MYSKCEFWLRSVTFLGHVISNEGVEVGPRNIEAVKNWPRPLTPTNIRSFLGLVVIIGGLWMVLRPLHLP